ncbi:NapC/NirT family cytochrome c [Sansalvadorimonas verongulae]|uniref:NapC/NirT family cytochrome c n=1 Tax=Sansalvadorimonas verongulae TaxID=2172824 RepID=UPI0012BB6A22|nr:NapC/NirT family cytochrome c [Sansalvadorimonas verongulae]MTI14819.1 hypothetical protein [Sansalvadorimonas verongulae]
MSIRNRIPRWCLHYWTRLTQPVALALWIILAFGFIAGVSFWSGFNTMLEQTATEDFCTSCHGMTENLREIKPTIHYTNRSGVQATCSDCHLPHNFTNEIIRKVQASKEVFGAIAGTIDTRQKFQDYRLHMAKREWQRMKENDSQECRNCHKMESMDYTLQSSQAAYMHRTYLATGQATCIDCHKGIAHRLPDMENVPQWSPPSSGAVKKKG